LTDAKNKKIPSSQTDWKGIASGSTIAQLALKAGTDQEYPIGAVVECMPTAAWADDLINGLLVSHKPNGQLADGVVSTGQLAGGSVTSAKLAPGKTVDANGWTVYDFGTFKEYAKRFTGGSVSGLGSLGSATLFSAQNLPVDVTKNDVLATIGGGTDGTSGSRYVWSTDINQSGSAATTFGINVRNITGTTLSESGLQCVVRLITA